jgi:hypothetical protein
MTEKEDFLSIYREYLELGEGKKPGKIKSLIAKGLIGLSGLINPAYLSGEEKRRETESISSRGYQDFRYSFEELTDNLKINKPSYDKDIIYKKNIFYNDIKNNSENYIIKEYNNEFFIKDNIKEFGEKINKNNFSYINTLPTGINLNVRDSVSINADNLGEFALPIVEYIHQTKPDFVVASDRGARLIGLAVHRLYRKLYGRFPTADGTMRFRRR